MCQGYTEKFMNSPYSFKGDFYTADKILGILFRYYFSSRIFDKANEILEFLEKFLNEGNLKTFYHCKEIRTSMASHLTRELAQIR